LTLDACIVVIIMPVVLHGVHVCVFSVAGFRLM
jgi:hypothetical protein